MINKIFDLNKRSGIYLCLFILYVKLEKKSNQFVICEDMG